MSIVEGLPVPAGWRKVRFGGLVRRRKEIGRPDLEPLSVFLDAGVVPRSSRSDNHNSLGEDLSKYLVVQPGDLVFNKLRTWQGGFGWSRHRGIVSPAYFVCRPGAEIDPRFANYLFHAQPYLAELARVSKWQPPSQFDTPWEQLRLVPLLVPPVSEQRRIADVLDHQCAQISSLHAECTDLLDRLDGPAIARFAELTGALPQVRVGYRFSVQLGKMLDEKQIDSADVCPYLRNTNVQWDRLELGDLKSMTFAGADRRKYELRTGDLLVCEGGQPGRAAIWNGELTNCYFQKAIMRVRSRGKDSTRYLMWCLRLASVRGDFAAGGTGTTILHLPAERLIATRVPLPSPNEQRDVLIEIDAIARGTHALSEETGKLSRQLGAYREALITEAVTGQLGITELSDQQLDESGHAVVGGGTPEVVAG